MAEPKVPKLPRKLENLQAKTTEDPGASRVKNGISPWVKREVLEVPKGTTSLGLESLPVKPFPFMKLPPEIRVMWVTIRDILSRFRES